MKKFKNIIYVNYSPYENSGKILDFLLENFEHVFLFSLGFHHLKNKTRYNRLLVYEDAKLVKEHLFFQMPTVKQLIFLLLPIKSLITFIQVILYTFLLTRRYGKLNFYFTVNAFTAWIGNFMKGFGIVDKTIFWVWDYYPPIHENKIVMLMRQIYWQFDKIGSHSDRVAFVNQRLIDLRKDIGVLQKDVNYSVVPIGTDKFDVSPKPKKDIAIGFIGVLKKSHGLDVAFDNEILITKHFPKMRLEIIGSGPDEKYFKKKAKKSSIKTKFYGYVEDDAADNILKECSIGIATYTPDKSNVSYYGDPGKIKRYLSLGIPVIATNIFEFSKEIERSGAGIIIDYHKKEEFTKGMQKIMENYEVYSRNALKLSRKFYYKKIYPQIFNV